jgi:hypothetical protein
MTSNISTAANGGLSQEVKKILEVPPKWVVRNGGFLILTYVGFIYFLFNVINIPQTFVSQVKFYKPASGLRDRSDILGSISIGNRFLSRLKSGKLLKLIDKNGEHNFYYYARITSIKKGRDSSTVLINIAEKENVQQFQQIRAKEQLKLSVEIGSASMMADVMKSHSKQ